MQNFAKAVVSRIPVLSFILSFVVAWLLIPISKGFPMVPFVIFFACLATLVYVVRKDRSWFDTVLYIGILSLSYFLLNRSNDAVQVIDFLFIFLFGSILILPIAREHKLTNLLLTPILMIREALAGKNIFPYSLGFLKKYNKIDNFKGYFLSILVTLLFLGITIPLLASANPFFDKLIGNIFNFFDLEYLMRYLNAEQIAINILRVLILGFFAYIIPRVLTASYEGVQIKEANVSLPINYLIPKFAMSILLVLFFVTQAQLYFATPEVLQSMGYTNSRLTNEVFFQVTIVAFIIFFLTYLDKERKTWNKRLTYFLILEAFFLVGIAYKSVHDYSSLWGLTEKRLWGYATMSWLTGVLLLFAYYYKKQIPMQRFFQLVIAYSVVVLVGINIANFDYLISHNSKARTQNGTDYAYLARLSPDAGYYKETLDNLVTQIEESSIPEYEKMSAAYLLIIKIEDLKWKYNNEKPINSFNFSEYNEYLNIRDFDVQPYRDRLSIVDQKYYQQETVNPQQL